MITSDCHERQEQVPPSWIPRAPFKPRRDLDGGGKRQRAILKVPKHRHPAAFDYKKCLLLSSLLLLSFPLGEARGRETTRVSSDVSGKELKPGARSPRAGRASVPAVTSEHPHPGHPWSIFVSNRLVLRSLLQSSVINALSDNLFISLKSKKQLISLD